MASDTQTRAYLVNPLRRQAPQPADQRQRFYYDFRLIQSGREGWDLDSYIDRTAALFRPSIKNWDIVRCQEWQLRSYLSVKLIAQATLLAGSLKFSTKHNLSVVVPYLRYYTVLNCARALLMTCPDFPFAGRSSIELSHAKVMNATTNAVARFGASLRREHAVLFRVLRDQREVFSYGLPLSGKTFLDEHGASDDSAIEMAVMYSELAQLNSEILYYFLQRHHPDFPRAEPTDDQVRLACYHGIDEMPDWDDLYRFARHFRSFGMPVPLDWTATEGFVDDVLSGWTPDDEPELQFDPDEYPRAIFNFN
jgi:hypothetical protein